MEWKKGRDGKERRLRRVKGMGRSWMRQKICGMDGGRDGKERQVHEG